VVVAVHRLLAQMVRVEFLEMVETEPRHPLPAHL
jgi:hypothetical protein